MVGICQTKPTIECRNSPSQIQLVDLNLKLRTDLSEAFEQDSVLKKQKGHKQALKGS
jgi:hypothetical protein